AALRAEAAALAVEGVTQVQAASASYGRDRIFLAASNGFSGHYARTSSSVYAVAISGEGAGMERDYKGEARVFRADLPPPEDIGRIAGERAAARAGSRQPPSGTFPVVYDRRVSSSLIGHLLGAVNGAAIVRGSSWLRDALGEAILPEALSLVEEPLRPRIFGSRPFDAEGLARRDRAIIDRGVLTGWTLDLATGRKLGMDSTANAARGPASPPSPSVTNVTLTPGDTDRAGLLGAMGTGLLITSFMGSTINPTTGEYSRGASGFWVENGQIAYPVNECTIAGNLRDMLGRIVPANDAEDHLSHRVPSILVDAMVIAGA
ncbi:MAG TPA: TldD/PmbA family protein, partial [Aliiroseovarius sp.]|nr:TldD/PmbA family protein [Aliiroseovarius sp.]